MKGKLNVNFLRNFHIMQKCFGNIIRKIKNLLPLYLRTCFWYHHSTLKNNNLLPNQQSFQPKVRGISMTWFLLIFFFKERCKQDFLSSEYEPLTSHVISRSHMKSTFDFTGILNKDSARQRTVRKAERFISFI